MTVVAALYVMKDGPYYGIPDVDPWDKDRDARLYRGPHPVVAHPPCQLWGSFAHVNFKRYGGEHNRPGNDQGCFESALGAVRGFGGVLEHPAFTHAWKTYGLSAPRGVGWIEAGKNEWVCEVWQSAYGHLARKRTWLLYVGENRPMELRWERPEGTHQIGWHDQRGRERNKPTLSGRRASETPHEFRDALLSLARSAVINSYRPGAAGEG